MYGLQDPVPHVLSLQKSILPLQYGWLLTVANCGDSRALLDTCHEILPLTVDHRISSHQADRRRLQALGAQIAPIDGSGEPSCPAHARLACVIYYTRLSGPDCAKRSFTWHARYTHALYLAQDDYCCLPCTADRQVVSLEGMQEAGQHSVLWATALSGFGQAASACREELATLTLGFL